MRVDKAEIVRVLQDEPAFSQIFISHILTRNARVEEDLVDQLFKLDGKSGSPASCCSWPISARRGSPSRSSPRSARKPLADMIGTTRSRVSHFMNKFRSLGFIEYNGHLEVHPSLLSVVLNDQPNTVEPPS